MRTLHNFTRILFSLTVQDIKSTLTNVETKGISVNVTAFSY